VSRSIGLVRSCANSDRAADARCPSKSNTPELSTS
jgi:hypothetical protein